MNSFVFLCINACVNSLAFVGLNACVCSFILVGIYAWVDSIVFVGISACVCSFILVGIYAWLDSIVIPPLPKGEGGILFYLCPSISPSVQDIFQHIFLSNCWWQKSDIWSQASYRYPISWEVFFDPSDSYFLFAEERGYHRWALAHSSSCFDLFCGVSLSLFKIKMIKYKLGSYIQTIL